MSKYFYHGLGTPYSCDSVISKVLKILVTGGLKCKRNLNMKDYGYNGLDYVSVCKKYPKEEYSCYGSTAWSKFVQNSFCFIISDEVDAIKTETIPKSYWYFPDIIEKMRKHPENRYSDMFDEWQIKGNVPLASIVGVGIPLKWLENVDWKFHLHALEELKNTLNIIDFLGLDIVDSTEEDFIEKYERRKQEEPNKVQKISIDI